MRLDPPTATSNRSGPRAWRSAIPVLGVALAAAIWTVDHARGMWTAPGTMGMDPTGFVAMWSVMMAAMMLPSMAPLASLYVRSLGHAHPVRGTLFVGGYVLLWAASGVAAYGLAAAADLVVMRGGFAPRLFAATVFATAAVYNCTSLKHRLLRQCRNPLGLLVTYAGYRGRCRALRAGLHHGLTCLGCCWSLMALMMVFGAMNVAAMVVLGLVVAIEKLSARGVLFARGAGAVSALLALVVLAVPEMAVGLTGADRVMAP